MLVVVFASTIACTDPSFVLMSTTVPSTCSVKNLMYIQVRKHRAYQPITHAKVVKGGYAYQFHNKLTLKMTTIV